MLPVITNDAIRKTTDATPASGAGGVPVLGGVTSAGILYPLGSRASLPATRTNRGLLVVTSAHALRQGLRPSDPDVDATDEVVNVWADSGDLELVYVKNTSGGVILRGTIVTADAGGDGPYDVDEAALADECGRAIGVALFEIPADSCAWVASRGKVYVRAQAGAGWTADDTIKVSINTVGCAMVVAALTDDSIGWALDTTAPNALGLAQITCRG